MTLSELYQKVRRSIMEKEDAETATFIARQLLCKATDKTKEQILSDWQMYVSDKTLETTEEMAARILAGEPLAYVIGEWEFYGMTLYVNPGVLIPRDDTCAVTDLAIQQALYLGENPRILDLCAGSGCIGLAIASRVNDAKVTLADISRDALQVSRKNISAQRLSARVSCVQVDALQDPPTFLGKFDMIVSNPPYVTTGQMNELPHSVVNYEPHLALHGGDDGLLFYRSIVDKYRSALKPGGYLCFEFGMGQGDAVCALLEENGFTILERSRDYNQRERAALARYDRKEA